jgi:DNA-binding transcriptional LysR family regulator
MDLRRIRYFLAVAEELHFGRAAERVHVVQSAVSQQIKLLEEELGFSLFERTRQKVRLTIAGEVFVAEAQTILRQCDGAIAKLAAAVDGTLGRLIIGFVENVLWSPLPRAVRTFRDRYPTIDLKLLPLDPVAQIEALQSGSIDVGIMPAPLLSTVNIQASLFISGSLLIAIPQNHRFAGRRTVSFSELAEESFVLFPRQMRTRLVDIVVTACANAGFTPRIAQEAEHLHTLLALASAGLGLTVVPEWMARASHFGVSYAKPTEELPRVEILLAWRRGSTNPAIARLRAVVDATVREDEVGEVAEPSIAGKSHVRPRKS